MNPLLPGAVDALTLRVKLPPLLFMSLAALVFQTGITPIIGYAWLYYYKAFSYATIVTVILFCIVLRNLYKRLTIKTNLALGAVLQMALFLQYFLSVNCIKNWKGDGLCSEGAAYIIGLIFGIIYGLGLALSFVAQVRYVNQSAPSNFIGLFNAIFWSLYALPTLYSDSLYTSFAKSDWIYLPGLVFLFIAAIGAVMFYFVKPVAGLHDDGPKESVGASAKSFFEHFEKRNFSLFIAVLISAVARAYLAFSYTHFAYRTFPYNLFQVIGAIVAGVIADKVDKMKLLFGCIILNDAAVVLSLLQVITESRFLADVVAGVSSFSIAALLVALVIVIGAKFTTRTQIVAWMEFLLFLLWLVWRLTMVEIFNLGSVAYVIVTLVILAVLHVGYFKFGWK